MKGLNLRSGSIYPIIVSCVALVKLLSYSGLISAYEKRQVNNNTHLRTLGITELWEESRKERDNPTLPSFQNVS